ncbi:polysaccharide deacetylase [Clostridiaceae bacterium]|nr:polysaccharide deacetylase family protein [Clostridium sp.]NBI69633.1 polysaccharide deacetylase [Clostridiaceae bacterium]
MRRNATQVKRWTTIILTAACMLGATLMAYAKDPTGPALEALTEQETDGPAAPQEEEIQAQEPPQPQEAPDEAASQGQETQPEENRADGLVLSGGRYLDPNAPMVALTFDDGPYAPVGNRIMDSMEQYDGRCTFFVVGDRVASYPSEILRMHQNGHEIGNHTYNHKYLDKLNAEQVRSQVELCRQAVASVTGEAPVLVRLPGGRKNGTVLANIPYPIIMWNLDTRDWKTRNASSSIQSVLGGVKDGDIILMHELYSASGDAAAALIPALRERGFQLVTVSELARFRGGLQNGALYYSFGR